MVAGRAAILTALLLAPLVESKALAPRVRPVLAGSMTGNEQLSR
jgi:hypothetical protein